MSTIKKDAFRYTKSLKSVGLLKAFLTKPGFRFVVLMRLCNKYGKLNPIGTMARVWYSRLKVKYGFQIPHITKIGAGLFMGHYGNIVVNEKAIIGKDCNLAQGVTIGYVSAGKKKGCPEIGDRVWIGANSVIAGKIKIGNDVLIAPLNFINFDIPDNSVVVNGEIVGTKGSAGYVNNVLDENA